MGERKRRRCSWHVADGNYDYLYQLSRKWGMSMNSALNNVLCKLRDKEGYIHYSDNEEVSPAMRTGTVYVFGDGTDLYKIGCSRFPEDRKRDLQAGSSRAIVDVCLIECMYAEMREIEHYLHEYFAAKRTHGEWFRLSQSDIAWIHEYKLKRASNNAVMLMQLPCTPK